MYNNQNFSLCEFYVNNKSADQLLHLPSLISIFVICWLDYKMIVYLKYQGPVVQSIVSLMMFLRRQLVKHMLTSLSNTCTLIFFLEKM